MIKKVKFKRTAKKISKRKRKKTPLDIDITQRALSKRKRKRKKNTVEKKKKLTTFERLLKDMEKKILKIEPKIKPIPEINDGPRRPKLVFTPQGGKAK
jgi:hypothetical protein